MTNRMLMLEERRTVKTERAERAEKTAVYA